MSRAIDFVRTAVVDEEIRDFRETLEGFEAGKLHESEWQKRRLWQGIYGQRQPGVQMVRIKIPYGVTDAKQLRAMCGMADTLTNSILHITTRSAIQLHYIPRGLTPKLLEMMADCGLTSREACGNTVRNVSADPYASITPEQAFDIIPAAEALVHHCLRNPYTQNFPRKFKISFSGDNHGDHGLSAMHDIGFVAVRDANGLPAFDVWAAGGLGGRPVAADCVHPALRPAELLLCATALMRVFNEFGNRKDRNKARMKFIKLERGAEWFNAQYRAEFDRLAASEYGKSLIIELPDAKLELPKASADFGKAAALVGEAWAKACVFVQNKVDTYGLRVRIRMGDIDSTAMRSLCDLAEQLGNGEMRLTVNQNMVIPNIPLGNLADAKRRLEGLKLADPRYSHISNVVACPGRSTCNLSVTSSKGLADVLIDIFENEPELAAGVEDGRIHISGCHNGCGQHGVASLGFNGSSRVVEGKAVPCAMLSIGGKVFDGARRLSRRVGRVTAKKAPAAVKAIIAHYKTLNSSVSFDEWLGAVDVKEVQALVKPFDTVEASDLDLYRDYEQAEGDEYSPAVGLGECAGGALNLVTEAFDDALNFLKMGAQVQEKGYFADTVFNAREALRHALRATLIEAGEAIAELTPALEAYIRFYGLNGKLPAVPESLLAAAASSYSKDEAASLLAASKGFVDTWVRMYRNERENCKPQVDLQLPIVDGRPKLDLSGVTSTIGFIKARHALATLGAGAEIEILVDTGDPYRNIPASLKNDGHRIVQLAPINEDTQYSLILVKDGLKG